jgi:hypothetical protein
MVKILTFDGYRYKGFTSFKALENHYLNLYYCYDTPQGIDNIHKQCDYIFKVLQKDKPNYINFITLESQTLNKQTFKELLLIVYERFNTLRIYKA